MNYDALYQIRIRQWAERGIEPYASWINKEEEMKTKYIEKLYEEWAIAWACSGQELVEFMAQKIKKHFQRRKPKCVWTKVGPQGSSGFTRWNGSCSDEPYAFTNSPLGECPNKYCPMCGGKIEVQDQKKAKGDLHKSKCSWVYAGREMEPGDPEVKLRFTTVHGIRYKNSSTCPDCGKEIEVK